MLHQNFINPLIQPPQTTEEQTFFKPELSMDQCVNERPDCKEACQATQNVAICQPKY